MANGNQQQQYQRERSGERPQGSGQFMTESVNIGLPWRLMIFTFVLFLFSILIFAGLRWGYTAYLDNEIEAVDQQMEELAAQVSESEQQEFLTFYSQMVNLRSILDRRSFSQNIFGFLEENTLPTIYYNGAEYASDQMSVIVSGQADSMQTFVNQMQVFGESEQVDSAILEEVSVQQGRAVFSLRILFNPSFLQQPGDIAANQNGQGEQGDENNNQENNN